MFKGQTKPECWSGKQITQFLTELSLLTIAIMKYYAISRGDVKV